MNRDRFDHSLSGWLADQSSTPTYLDEAMARTRATRQRPAWSFPERWLPMQLTMRRAYVPRPFFYLALVALLAIAVAAAALTIGAGVRAACVAEELAFEEIAREGTAVHRDELSVAAALLVDRLGDELLARSTLAEDEDVDVVDRKLVTSLERIEKFGVTADHFGHEGL